jgi:hypothetical protein
MKKLITTEEEDRGGIGGTGRQRGVAKTLWDSSTEQTREKKQKPGVQ